MSINVKKRIMDVGYEGHTNEKKYIKDILKCFIDNQGVYKGFSNDNKWEIILDHDGQVKYLVLGYILYHFSLWELYIIFYSNQVDYSFNYSNIHKSRKIAISNINSCKLLTIEESNRIKKKVWDLNLIIFGLILEMIHLSELFWDAKEKKVIFPNFEIQSDNYHWLYSRDSRDSHYSQNIVEF